MKKVAIIGAGITGLTAGFELAGAGENVTIFEKQSWAGGLAAGFRKKGWEWSLEYYPHHFFTADGEARGLIKRLGLEEKLFFKRPKTSIYLKGKIFQFDSPLSILAAPGFSLKEKVRIGLTTAWLKAGSNWKDLEKETAASWLVKHYGREAYGKLWEPLLRGKFAKEAERVAMSWFWARIKSRTPRLGYLEGGLAVLIEELSEKIKKSGGKIILNEKIEDLGSLRKEFEKIILTVPTSVFLEMAPELPEGYKKKFGKLKMIGALGLVLILKEQFLKDGTYWLNINEENFPFVFADEHTNFADPSHYGENHLLYVGGYYPHDHDYFKAGKEKVLKKFIPYLEKISPSYKIAENLLDSVWQTDLYAQPIVPTNYSEMIPSYETPLEGVFLANLQQIYPWDRGVNYSIELGRKIAKMVAER